MLHFEVAHSVSKDSKADARLIWIKSVSYVDVNNYKTVL